MGRRRHSLPVSSWGLSTGFDSGDPRCRRKIERITIAAMAKNSLCQFCNDSNQNREVPAYYTFWTSDSHAQAADRLPTERLTPT
jgi:hypothetical protein